MIKPQPGHRWINFCSFVGIFKTNIHNAYWHQKKRPIPVPMSNAIIVNPKITSLYPILMKLLSLFLLHYVHPTKKEGIEEKTEKWSMKEL